MNRNESPSRSNTEHASHTFLDLFDALIGVHKGLARAFCLFPYSSLIPCFEHLYQTLWFALIFFKLFCIFDFLSTTVGSCGSCEKCGTWCNLSTPSSASSWALSTGTFVTERSDACEHSWRRSSCNNTVKGGPLWFLKWFICHVTITMSTITGSCSVL